MSSIDKLILKGKAKVKEFRDQQHSGHIYAPQQQQQYQQHYPPQQYPPQQYPAQNYNYQQHAPPPPHQLQQQQQWAPPGPQHQQSYGPPIPLGSKPQSSASLAPPIPPNRPTSTQPSPAQQQQIMSPPPQGVPPQSQNMPPPPPGDTTYWKPIFNDSTPVHFYFRHETGDHGWGNDEKQMYTSSPANSFHHDNRLVVRGLVQNGSYTSARLNSLQTLSRPRGYLTATILAPVADGIWPAYWLLPAEPCTWPVDGEVDIFESWNGDCVNHSCLHWGHYNGEDWNKHRVIDTHLSDMASRPHTFGFAWSEEEGIPGWRGRLVWYIDERPVMRANIPLGTRRMEDFRILINVAMGGKVCNGKLPRDGYYDMIVSELKMCGEPPQGWASFEHAWGTTPEGKTM